MPRSLTEGTETVEEGYVRNISDSPDPAGPIPGSPRHRIQPLYNNIWAMFARLSSVKRSTWLNSCLLGFGPFQPWTQPGSANSQPSLAAIHRRNGTTPLMSLKCVQIICAIIEGLYPRRSCTWMDLFIDHVNALGVQASGLGESHATKIAIPAEVSAGACLILRPSSEKFLAVMALDS